MSKVTRTTCCDICGEPLDQRDFYELALSRKVTTTRTFEAWGEVRVRKDRRAERVMPGMKLCAQCGTKEGERMAYLLRTESE